MHTQLHDLLPPGRAVAIKAKGGDITYDKLLERIEDDASALVELGVELGQRVALFMKQDHEWVITAYAIMKAGGVLVPVDPASTAEQVEHITEDCGATFIITDGERLGSRVPLKKHLGIIGPSLIKNTYKGYSYPRVVQSDLAAIFYTSGSTGLPKGVALTHANLIAGVESVVEYTELSRSDRVLAALPLHFDAGFNQVTTALSVGAVLVVEKFMTPAWTIATIRREHITVLTGVPVLWRKLTDHLKREEDLVQTLRIWANTGGAVDKNLYDDLRAVFPETKPYLMYGLTEAFRGTYLNPYVADKKPGSVGKAIPGSRIEIHDENGRKVPNGTVGEIVQFGSTVSLGYWNSPVGRFIRRPGTGDIIGVRSGDLGYQDVEGDLWFVGRKDEQIKISGRRFSPTEIENLILEHGPKNCVVFGQSDVDLGQSLVVVVDQILLKQLDEILPRTMHPLEASIKVVPVFPSLSSGKIDRKKVKADFGG